MNKEHALGSKLALILIVIKNCISEMLQLKPQNTSIRFHPNLHILIFVLAVENMGRMREPQWNP